MENEKGVITLLKDAPPIPNAWVREVPRSPIAVPLGIPYIVAQVVQVGRGSLGYEEEEDLFVAYLKLEEQDRRASIIFNDSVEVWVAFRPSLVGSRRE